MGCAGDYQGGAPLSRLRFRFRIAIFAYKSRIEVLQHYQSLNAGGTPHSPEEIERVRQLLMAVHAAHC